MSSLPTQLRRQMEAACKQARKTATKGSKSALNSLAVHEPEPYHHMDEVQRDLRRKLRAQAKQLGDAESPLKRGAYEINHLVEKLAYDQWHRLLFARFLFENNLLISPEHGVPVTLDDCEELAPALKLKDAWAVAACFAAKELPDIFRTDDPAGEVELSVEDRNPLIQLVTILPTEVFTAVDSLGWCYQFWQADRKDEVNASGKKVGEDELPAVTQLFTEDYMVDFLLDNTLGAWQAGKFLGANPKLAETAESEVELRRAVALPECEWKYLRFIRTEDGKWAPAAGTFDGWPRKAKNLRCLDPCMGSGHFIVAMFERLVALRISEEHIDEALAIADVIRQNLFGLEIDRRCTQIAAFNLALAAWRRVGHCALPAMNLACSGVAPNGRIEDWLELAGDDDRLRNGMDRLYVLFKDAPILGSLINPRAGKGDLLVASFHEIQPLLERALAKETKTNDDTAHELAVTARGLARAAEILSEEFTLVATNVPYLGRLKQNELLRKYCERVYPHSKADLATCFIERCSVFCESGGTNALVTPQNWLFLRTFTDLREALLKTRSWNTVVQLGEEAWWSFGMRGPRTVLFVFSESRPRSANVFLAIDASTNRSEQPILREEKAERLSDNSPTTTKRVCQKVQLSNPTATVVFEPTSGLALLSEYANSVQGASTLDIEMFRFRFWEVTVGDEWVLHQTSPSPGLMFSGLEYVSIQRRPGGRFDKFAAELKAENRLGGAWSGQPVWGKFGVSCAWMGTLPTAIYLGTVYDNSIAAIIPKNSRDLLAIWCFCSSPSFFLEVRKINHKSQVANATLVKVPFDINHWQQVASETFPDGLPMPSSNDPTQWLFNGNPKASDQPLHVAMARLLGYRWPRQVGSSVPGCPSVPLDGLETLAEDGIVCLSASMGEPSAAERLRLLLVKSLGKVDLAALIVSAGLKGSRSESLEDWLRDEFFEQHCAIFHQRPFIWHIWDGHKSGFSAFVSYHAFDHSLLEKLTFSYLGDWLRRQQASVDAGESGGDARLQAAKELQVRLKLILEGDPPYDVFVRWKQLAQQSIGWYPDLNDGVRINIRPFAVADVLKKRVKIKWDKDRGKEPARDKKEFPWLWGWDGATQDFAGIGKEPDGNRWNDCHYTIEFKKKAREAKKTG